NASTASCAAARRGEALTLKAAISDTQQRWPQATPDADMRDRGHHARQRIAVTSRSPSPQYPVSGLGDADLRTPGRQVAVTSARSAEAYQAADCQVGAQGQGDAGHELKGVAQQPVLGAPEQRLGGLRPQLQERERDDDQQELDDDED